jgi:putative transposase
MDYIHYNPVKHGYVTSAKEWPHSTLNYWMQKGLYEPNWGMIEPTVISKMELE